MGVKGFWSICSAADKGTTGQDSSDFETDETEPWTEGHTIRPGPMAVGTRRAGQDRVFGARLMGVKV